MTNLCIIPARSQSKGIRNKNLKKVFKNKSLTELAYDCALKSKIFDKIVISTDSKKYFNFFNSKNIPMYLLRPKKIAKKNSTDLEVLFYELKRYQNFFNTKFDIICLLQPTSPLRKIKHIKECYNLIKKKKFDAVWTITKISNKFHPLKILKIKKNNLNYYDKNGKSFKSRQLLSTSYIRNGIAYFFSNKAILKKKSILPNNSGYLIIKEKVINIDSQRDLKKTRAYFNKK